MDKSKRKEIVSEWKERKPEMGVVSIKCVATDENFLDISKDTSTAFNRHKFQLSGNLHTNKHLQELWNTYGENGFEFKVISTLKYDNVGEVRTSDLKELLEICLMELPSSVKI